MMDNEIDTKDKYSDGDVDDDSSIDTEENDDNVDLPTLNDINVNDDEGVTFAGRILELWKQHQAKLLHNYARFGYILSWHPVTMKHSQENMSMEDKEAAQRLMTKLFIPVNVVGNAQVSLQDKLIHQFLEGIWCVNFL